MIFRLYCQTISENSKADQQHSGSSFDDDQQCVMFQAIYLERRCYADRDELGMYIIDFKYYVRIRKKKMLYTVLLSFGSICICKLIAEGLLL